MLLNITFITSGIIIAALIMAKMIEDKIKRKPLLLRLVSLGDERVRVFTHELAHKYSDMREKVHFAIHKQIPLHSKNLLNKTKTALGEKFVEYIGDVRGSKFLSKSDGISEFLRSISEKENDGRIDDESLGEPKDSQQEDFEVK
ncbi:MAG: hypothetical protein ACYCY6_01020 [Minisyncoccota bacterium]